MTHNQVTCPDCKGSGEQLATGIVYAPGHSGPWARMAKCSRCDGDKTVPEAMLQWIERGKEIRRQRRAMNLTLAKVASRRGIRVVEWSCIEMGKVDNSHVELPLFGEDSP